MNDIQINTGVVRLSVSVDGVNGKSISFNPSDLVFVERIHKLYFDLKQKQELFRTIKGLDDSNEEMPNDISNVTEPIREINLWFREQIDILLGEGTSQSIFGDVIFVDERLGVYFQLLDAVIGYTKPVRSKAVEQFLPPDKKRKQRKR